MTPTRWLLLSYGTFALIVLTLPTAAAGIPAAGRVLLFLAPAMAAAACITAARRLPRALGMPWVLAAGAGMLAAAAQLAAGGGLQSGAGPTGAHAFFIVSSNILFAVALAWALHLRDRERGIEILLDNALLIASATLVTLRWAPGVRDVMAGQVDGSFAVLAGIVVTPIAAGCAFLFAVVLSIVYAGGVGTSMAVALTLGAAALGVAAMPLALGLGGCCAAGAPASSAMAIGWVAVAFAGFAAARIPAAQIAVRGTEAGGQRLRLVVAPAVAIVMAAVVIDAAWGEPIYQSTALTLGVAGVLLALRVSQLLYATHRLSAERIELAQTKMLVDVGQALAGTTDLQTTLQVVTGWAKRMLNARAAAIELLDDTGEQLEFRAIDGLPLDTMQLKFPVEGSFTGWVVRHGRARSSADPRLDPAISEASREVLGKSPTAAAPLRYHDHVLGALSCIGDFPFNERDLELLGALADQAAVAIENARLFAQVHTLSVTDPLTSLPNRRQLARDLAREFAAARRGRRLVAIMFDLNGFKEYNDRHGHVAGDEALKLFRAALAAETRAMNLAARYGGDEFLALLADADRYGAEIFIERVRSRFPGDTPLPDQSCLSVAAGVAEYTPDMKTAEELVSAADRALYQAKSALKKLRA